jgi:hypothetical protein
VSFWFRADDLATGITQNMFVAGRNTGNSSVDYIGLRSTVATLSLWVHNRVSGSQQNGLTTLSANTWYFVALVRSSATAAILYRGSESAAAAAETSSNTTDVSSRFSCTHLTIAAGFNGGSPLQFFAGRIHSVKIWDAALTLAELQNEQWIWRPQRWADLRSWYPTWDTASDRNLDYFNGYTFTESGTISVALHPSISYG